MILQHICRNCGTDLLFEEGDRFVKCLRCSAQYEIGVENGGPFLKRMAATLQSIEQLSSQTSKDVTYIAKEASLRRLVDEILLTRSDRDEKQTFITRYLSDVAQFNAEIAAIQSRIPTMLERERQLDTKEINTNNETQKLNKEVQKVRSTRNFIIGSLIFISIISLARLFSGSEYLVLFIYLTIAEVALFFSYNGDLNRLNAQIWALHNKSYQIESEHRAASSERQSSTNKINSLQQKTRESESMIAKLRGEYALLEEKLKELQQRKLKLDGSIEP